jgi:mannose-6-phosphate isomerase-like protein (cupin superfamily)
VITRSLSPVPDVTAPDGSEVRLLAGTPRGSMAHFRLRPGQVSKAVAHHGVEEIWFVVSGVGQIWRKSADQDHITELTAGISVSILPGTSFQFRNLGDVPLDIVGVTMPPWPGMDEAYAVPGVW